MQPDEPDTVPSANVALGPLASAHGTPSNEGAVAAAPPSSPHPASTAMPSRRTSRRMPHRTGDPGPSGMPITYHAMKNSVHTTVTISAYGIISAITVPMPASRW